MNSTLTAEVKDGKQSRKIERSSAIGVSGEILLLYLWVLHALFAQHLPAAQ
ncbi:hypothetical protein [Pseudomonas sp. SDO5271_S396]